MLPPPELKGKKRMTTAEPLPVTAAMNLVKRTVLVYRNEILSFSETFIKAQTEALHDFHPVLIGLRPTVRSLKLASEPLLLTHDQSLLARVKRGVYKQTGFAAGFARKAQELHPSLVHAHFAPDGAMALPLVKKLGVPLIVTLHGYDVTLRDEFHKRSKDGAIFLQRRKELWERASLFICISEFIRRKAIEIGFPPEKLRVHYIGIDLDGFAPSTEVRQNGLILFVGRLVEKKGCAYLIRAMRRVIEKCPTAELAIIGDGPEKKKLEALARDFNVPCTFLGPQPSDIIRSQLARAKVFCAPSIVADNGDAEGLGIVFCEAQAMGTPVVSFASGGIPEVVLHQKTGLLAPEKDESTLADYLLRYLTDELLWKDNSEEGKRWIARQFDLKQQTRKLESIYREVIAADTDRV